MQQLHLHATKEAESRYEAHPSLEDDLASYQSEIDTFYSNLKEYRAHLAHKFSEANFDGKFYSSFDKLDVVVISDWKMKILASKYRESQQGRHHNSTCFELDSYLMSTNYLFL